MLSALFHIFASILIFLPTLNAEENNRRVLVPTISSDWWQIADIPDLEKYTSAKQQPVGFGIWQAEDSSWQLWSCIRYTNCGGNTRLFYRWEAKEITDRNLESKGIAKMADTS